MALSLPPTTAGKSGSVWSVVLDPATGGGCSTLDLLKRVPYEDAAAPSPLASAAVRAEMASIVRAKQLEHALKQQGATKKGHAATIATIGERLDQTKQEYVPGTPVERTLKGGRHLRVELGASRSMPTLSTTPGPTDGVDALDQAVHQIEQQQQRAISAAHVTRAVAVRNEDPHISELREQRQQLEQQLLHATQKLCRKYTQQLFPQPTLAVSPDRTRQLADQWARSETMSERDKYALFMGNRFSTQQQRDFYQRDLESREPENDRHKRETAHTKYGNALARTKHSLRAKF